MNNITATRRIFLNMASSNQFQNTDAVVKFIQTNKLDALTFPWTALLLQYEQGRRSALEQQLRTMGRPLGIHDLFVTVEGVHSPYTLTIRRGER